MSGEGFLDPVGAAAEARAIREMMRTAGEDVFRSKVEALVDLIDERIEADRRARPSMGQRIALGAQNINRRLRAAFGHNLGGDDMAEQQLLQRENMILQLGMVIFGHRVAPSNPAQASHDGQATHRLSETSE